MRVVLLLVGLLLALPCCHCSPSLDRPTALRCSPLAAASACGSKERLLVGVYGFDDAERWLHEALGGGDPTTRVATANGYRTVQFKAATDEAKWAAVVVNLEGGALDRSAVEQLQAWHAAGVHLVGYSAVPPPLSARLTQVDGDPSLRHLIDASLLYHPSAFWGFQPSVSYSSPAQQHRRQTAAPRLLAVTPGSGGKRSSPYTAWLARALVDARRAGFELSGVLTSSAAETGALPDDFDAVLVVDVVQCEGYVSPWVRRLLADNGDAVVVVYLGGANAHFFLGNAPNLVDLRHYASSTSALWRHLHRRLRGSGNASAVDVLRPAVQRHDHTPPLPQLADCLADLARFVAWRTLLHPLPASYGLPDLRHTCAPLDAPYLPAAGHLFEAYLTDGSALTDVTVYDAGVHFWAEPEPSQVASNGCLLPAIRSCAWITDAQRRGDAHAVAVHPRLRSQLAGNYSWQPVVGVTLESAFNDGLNGALMANFSFLYSMHARDNQRPLGIGHDYRVLTAALDPQRAVPAHLQTDSAVFWAASNCDRVRLRLVSQLRDAGLPLAAYGACLNNRQPDAPGTRAWRQHKFYLSFENTACVDYISEKVWIPLLDGVVPIAAGAPNLLSVLPTTHCVVPVAAFATPGQLVRYVDWLGRSANAAVYQHLRSRDHVRLGFLYYDYLRTHARCSERAVVCNLVAANLANIEAAKRDGRPFPTLPPVADDSCDWRHSGALWMKSVPPWLTNYYIERKDSWYGDQFEKSLR